MSDRLYRYFVTHLESDFQIFEIIHHNLFSFIELSNGFNYGKIVEFKILKNFKKLTQIIGEGLKLIRQFEGLELAKTKRFPKKKYNKFSNSITFVFISVPIKFQRFSIELNLIRLGGELGEVAPIIK